MSQRFDNTIRIVGDALRSVDDAVCEERVEDCRVALANGHKIIASGLGKNVPVCEKFVGTMLSLGLNANFMHTNTAVHGDIGMVQPGDVVIILTKSGATAESVYLYDLLKERDCVVWLLTFEKDSVLGRQMAKSLVVTLEHEGDQWNIMPNNSTTLNLIVLQTIAMELAVALGISLPQFKKNHPGGHIGEVLRHG